MSLFPINRNPTRPQLAVFGVLWLVVFGVLGGMAWAKSHPTSAAAFLALAGLVPLAGLAVPGLLRLVYLAACYAAWPIGLVVSTVVLAGVYYLVLTPIGLVLRLLGHDPMNRRQQPDVPTYWVEHKADGDPGRYFHQS